MEALLRLMDWMQAAFFIVMGLLLGIFIFSMMIAGGILVAGISWQIIQAAKGIYF